MSVHRVAQQVAPPPARASANVSSTAPLQNVPAPGPDAASASSFAELHHAGRLGHRLDQVATHAPPAAAALRRAAAAGTLTARQVRLSHRPSLPLSPEGVAELARSMSGIGDPRATPIPDALQNGTARLDGEAIQMPGPQNARSPAALAAGVKRLNPRATRLVLGPQRYNLQARLNPWVSVATGNYLHGLPDPNPEPADGTPHPSEQGVVWSDRVLTPFNIGTYGNNSAQDESWTPQNVMQQFLNAAPRTQLELAARNFNGTTQHPNTGFGQITASRGWGGQPFIRTQQNNYGGTSAPRDYPALSGILDNADNPEELAHQMNRAAKGNVPNLNGLTPLQRNASSMVLGITQHAEQYRTQGSATFGRGALQAVSDGTMTFHQALNALPYANRGGAQNMRNVANGTTPLTDDQEMLAGLMDEETEKLWETPKHG
ncbi:hypothetical protein [Corallococcus aberystwythensis]|uniref:Uncharacterized protein n=1 Tax=Corallococcus aberystwythensis TaxID=2316722 RepID=A0A3A8QL86_9BACT|nr:hypothetical protein [Corallococcus aberystwythensis]RKH67105.1 hypothetical protein D7W81_14485 [Corallococcus aberystwythensis]